MSRIDPKKPMSWVLVASVAACATGYPPGRRDTATTRLKDRVSMEVINEWAGDIEVYSVAPTGLPRSLGRCGSMGTCHFRIDGGPNEPIAFLIKEIRLGSRGLTPGRPSGTREWFVERDFLLAFDHQVVRLRVPPSGPRFHSLTIERR